jgi:transposase-like protein
LTDYLLAADLQSAYAARADANAEAAGAYDQGSASYDNGGQASNQVTLSPEVKEAIAEEVKAQLEAQQQAAATQGGAAGDQGAAPAPTGDEVPPALDPARRTFVVDTPITVVSNGQECELTGGDVITRLTDTPDNNQQVNASVSASKKGECGAGQQVAVTVDQLEEMHNHFEEQLNNGLKTLAEKQGTGGLPKAPDTGTVASDIPTPTPDQEASKELSDQQKQADQTEAQAKQELASGGGQ